MPERATTGAGQGSGRRPLLLSAFGVHTGGGAVLLRELLAHAGPLLRLAALDSRFKGAVDPGCLRLIVPPDVGARLAASRRLAREGQTGDTLLCFNSLPPLRRSNARTIVYVHAPHFAGMDAGIAYDRRTRLRLTMEQALFGAGVSNADEYWVQTDSMAIALRKRVPAVPVRTMAFVDGTIAAMALTPRQPVAGPQRLLYPADAVGHKNHRNLLPAWQLLAQQAIPAILELTLESTAFAKLVSDTGTSALVGRSVFNLGALPRPRLLDRLQTASAMIFPSLAETFGLPLLEAAAMGVPILASERDFVHDVCTPAETFDPASPRSIARAVRRHLGCAEAPLRPAAGGAFVAALLS